MAQTITRNGLNYAKVAYNQDFTNVRAAFGVALQDFQPVVLSQLTNQLSAASTQITNLITTETTSRTASEQLLTNLINSNFTTLDARIQGVTEKITVVARVTDYNSLLAPIAGVDYAADISLYTRWVLVDNIVDTSQNGIYYQVPTATPNVYTVARVPDWATVGRFAAGLEIFVDQGTYQNTVYWVFDNAIASTDGTSFSVGFIPWQRPEFIEIAPNADSAFLSKIGNQISASLDAAYLSVASGALTWSAALVAWKGTIDLALVQVTALSDTVTQHTAEITTLESNVATNSTSINALSTASTVYQTAIANLETIDSTQSALLSNLRTDLDTDTAKNLEQDGRLSAIETVDANQTGQINSIADLNTVQDTRLGLIEGVNQAQDAAITGAVTINTVQDGRLSAIEAANISTNAVITTIQQVDADQTSQIASIVALNTVQDTRLGLIEGVNTTQDATLGGLRTDTDTGTAKNVEQDGRLTAIETSDAATALAITSVQGVNATQDTRLTAIELVDGQQSTLLTGLRADTDSGIARLTAIESVDANQTSQINSIAAVNTLQDTRLGLIEGVNTAQDATISTIQSIAGALQSTVAALPTTTNVNSIVINFLEAQSIIRPLTAGTTVLNDGIYQTTFNIDVTPQIAILGSTAQFRLVTLNDAVIPFSQSPPVLVNYPDQNTVSVVIQSQTSAVANDVNQVALHAFF